MDRKVPRFVRRAGRCRNCQKHFPIVLKEGYGIEVRMNRLLEYGEYPSGKALVMNFIALVIDYPTGRRVVCISEKDRI
jgi:hypothetical protein